MQLLARLRLPWDDGQWPGLLFIGASTCSPYRSTTVIRTPEHGLLLGFAALDEKAMNAAAAGLEAAFGDLESDLGTSGSAK